jgi:hypothetical protein
MSTRWPAGGPRGRAAAAPAAGGKAVAAAAMAATAAAAVALAAAAAAAVALAGCGSAAAPGSEAGTAGPGGAAGAAGPGAGAGSGVPASGAVSAAPGAPASAPGGAPVPSAAACTTAGLQVRLDTAAAGVAAGTYDVPLEFTNVSGTDCLLTGYPAVALTSGQAGQQIGTEAAVDRSVTAAVVTLAPGAVAHAWLEISDAADYPAKTCRPVTAAGFRVVVPGGQVASYLADRVPACKGQVPGGGILVVGPAQPGAARRGTA